MYTLCRAKSILRKVPAPEGLSDQPFDVSHVSTDKEYGMLMLLSEFWTAMNKASGLTHNTDPNPAAMCQYAYELASLYMSWVQVTSVIGADSDAQRMARLKLVEAVAKVLKACLNVIGIEDIERM
jgi:arginyl-tRNA synthetase